ncbi:hypothetical protein [Pseudomonas aeruginosa]|uniref:hypothetical protein n=1 Tax=Pseudomonas aeruginosa TaxID=287 RepID=UPI00053F075E|nr:hypothetical protein [Pseudomonas aeruginosa]HBO4733656.1 hypothetical protein [Pseudomonas aeruginosa]HBO6995345.1 hypothetical protein [Pseudomonas aeruginosa]HBO7065132.1 hypothetical protein [Pseudomonas aeruginosa]HBO7153941.1 hypothetical protein [Pseudomonas aeruginosa]HBO7494509.1 hypothetical protein [Pseudomonas aeruginosa]
MAKKEEAKSGTANIPKGASSKWCEVLEVSYIADRICQPGEKVLYDPGEDGVIGPNLREIKEDEAK